MRNMEYNIYEIDWKGNDCTDNAGSQKLDEAISMLKHRCENGKVARGCIVEIDDDGFETDVAYVTAPNAIGSICDPSYREALRNSMFGDDEAVNDDMEGTVEWGLNNLKDPAWWSPMFMISNEPVVDADDWYVVFTEEEVRDELIRVYREVVA